MKKEQANLDFIKMEHDVLDFWNNEKCFEKLVEKKGHILVDMSLGYVALVRFNYSLASSIFSLSAARASMSPREVEAATFLMTGACSF